MRFIVDEQLPPLLCEVLVSKGHETMHAISLGTGQRVSDSFITQRSVEEAYVVVTKDADFLSSFIAKGEPQKLVFVVTGNIKNRALLDLFRQHVHEIVELLAHNNVVEISRFGLRVMH